VVVASARALRPGSRHHYSFTLVLADVFSTLVLVGGRRQEMRWQVAGSFGLPWR
jgi:hypothetical protein